MLIVSFKIDRTLYQLHSDVLARQSDWFGAYRDQLGYDTHLLPAGWRAASTTLGTVYVHEQGDVQAERPSVIDRETGAIIVDGMTVEEMDAFLAVLYPSKSVLPRPRSLHRYLPCLLQVLSYLWSYHACTVDSSTRSRGEMGV